MQILGHLPASRRRPPVQGSGAVLRHADRGNNSHQRLHGRHAALSSCPRNEMLCPVRNVCTHTHGGKPLWSHPPSWLPSISSPPLSGLPLPLVFSPVCVNTLCTGQIIALRGRTTPRRVFGANCCHAQRGVQSTPASARADDGGWGSTVSPSFLTASNFFAAAAPPCPPLGVLRLPVAGDLFCALPPLAWFADDHHGAGARSLHLLLRRLCSQRPEPPQSLHRLLRRLCS
jgi:hypothetical protein